jgi:hypothetical protein
MFEFAVRIRDHPFMILARRIDENERDGRKKAAEQLMDELKHLIRESNSSVQEDTEED